MMLFEKEPSAFALERIWCRLQPKLINYRFNEATFFRAWRFFPVAFRPAFASTKPHLIIKMNQSPDFYFGS